MKIQRNEIDASTANQQPNAQNHSLFLNANKIKMAMRDCTGGDDGMVLERRLNRGRCASVDYGAMQPTSASC